MNRRWAVTFIFSLRTALGFYVYFGAVFLFIAGVEDCWRHHSLAFDTAPGHASGGDMAFLLSWCLATAIHAFPVITFSRVGDAA